MSVETVQKAFGTKARLTKAVYDETLVGDDEPVPLREGAAMTALFADPDPPASWCATRRSAGGCGTASAISCR